MSGPDPLEQSDLDGFLLESGHQVEEPAVQLAPLALGSKGWLKRLLDFYFRYDDPAGRQAQLARLQAAAAPEATRASLSEELAQQHLSRAQLLGARDLLSPRLRAALREEPEDGPLLTVGLLTTQWDLLQEISDLYGNTGSVAERQLELLTLTALGLERYKLARKLHKAHLTVAAGKGVKLDKLAQEVEVLLAPRGRLPETSRALGVGLGLAYLEARALARLAASFYERTVIEEEGLRQLHSFSRREKVDLVEVLIALAWSDGELSPDERRLIEQQIALAQLAPTEARRLLRRLDGEGEGASLDDLDLVPLDPVNRRFVLEQAVLLSLVDDDWDPAEESLLLTLTTKLGGAESELAQVVIEVVAFYEQNRASIKEFGPVSANRLAALRSTMGERAQRVVQENLRRVVQEVKETGELVALLSAASVRPLTAEETGKVKAQLIDVCKTVPALAIFLLPGGGLLLPILIKALPFSLLPSAFHPAELKAPPRLPLRERDPRTVSDRLRRAAREARGGQPEGQA